MTVADLLKQQEIMEQINLRPIKTPYGEYWIIELSPQAWRELRQDLDNTHQTYTDKDCFTLRELRKFTNPNPLPSGWQYMYGDKPFADIIAIAGKMAIKLR